MLKYCMLCCADVLLSLACYILRRRVMSWRCAWPGELRVEGERHSPCARCLPPSPLRHPPPSFLLLPPPYSLSDSSTAQHCTAQRSAPPVASCGHVVALFIIRVCACAFVCLCVRGVRVYDSSSPSYPFARTSLSYPCCFGEVAFLRTQLIWLAYASPLSY